MAWLETLSLTGVALAILAALLAGATVGYRGHVWLRKKTRRDRLRKP